MKITIFGLPGTGTSTTGKLLASKLNYDFKSSGDMFRAKANTLDLTLNDFEKLCQTDSKFDLELDQAVAQFGRDNDNFIFDSRLAWYFIPDAHKIKLICDEDESLKRIANRENKELDQVKMETKDRMTKITDRYKRYYELDDYLNDKNFDLIIDTTTIPPEEVVRQIMIYLNKKNVRVD